jgi:hypothetical protein
MIMSIGCYKPGCLMCQKERKKDDWIKKKVENLYRVNCRKKKRDAVFFEWYNKRKAQNLDTSEKKHYIEVDNQGVSK